MTCWVLVRLPATSYAFRHPTLARNMQGMPRMGRLAAATSSPFPCEAREKGLKTAAPSLPGQPEDPRLWRRAPNGAAIQGVESHPDGPPRMVKRPTGSGGEPSSPNCVVSAGGKARQPFNCVCCSIPQENRHVRSEPRGSFARAPGFELGCPFAHATARADALNATHRATLRIAASTPTTSRCPATGRVRGYKSAKVYIPTTVKVN